MNAKPWDIIFSDDAKADMRSLDKSQRDEVYRSEVMRKAASSFQL